ncbi:hypothetical protein NLG97_g8077 [Lecanicillium saksenae]|uniref:Uncharacterized protein n=1 Tax=Lecanicillium saksenae TaxID=468837 RepID=A0ACC1QL49_9HYPO|nr:hypothetical protein NLG97_g8077 [Lecanicillium saksenae]
MPVCSGIFSRGGRSLLLPLHEWLPIRKRLHALLNGTAIRQYDRTQETESTAMLANYCLNPGAWYLHHRTFSLSVIVRIIFGQQFKMSESDIIDLQAAVRVFIGLLGKTPLDWFPNLTKIPKLFQIWRGSLEKIANAHHITYKRWYDPMREQVERGTAPSSFLSNWLSDLGLDKAQKKEEEEAMYTVIELLEAGFDTTRQALNIMAMAAMEYPDVFRRARLEVDGVCGVGSDARLPTLADMKGLPYICAMVKEILRWRLITPFIIEHACSEDVEFDGYSFPAGTGFSINVAAVSNECDEPSVFRPERWLNGYEADVTHGLWIFGGGRRACVGSRVAQRSLFLCVSKLVQSVDFSLNGQYDSHVFNSHVEGEPFPLHASIRNAIICSSSVFHHLPSPRPSGGATTWSSLSFGTGLVSSTRICRTIGQTNSGSFDPSTARTCTPLRFAGSVVRQRRAHSTRSVMLSSPPSSNVTVPCAVRYLTVAGKKYA